MQFVLDHDAEGSVDFATLQGKLGTELLAEAGLPLDVSTMVSRVGLRLVQSA